MERIDLEQWKPREVARLLALVEKQRRYYQEIAASIPVGLLVLSSDLAVILANAAARRAFGLTGSDTGERRLDSLLPPWLLDRAEQVLKTGVAQSGILLDTGRAENRRLRIAISALRSWDESAPEALLAIEDITAAGVEPGAGFAAPPMAPEIPSEEGPAPEPQPSALAPSELIDNLRAVVWALELPSMRFAYASPQAVPLLGFPLERWTESPSFWADRVHPVDRAAMLESYQRAIRNRQDHTCEFRAVAADGRVVWLRESARLLPAAGGRPDYLIGITVDITERRLLEDQLVQSERVEAATKLASRMAHDLNNMLMILTGYGEELLSNLPAGSPLRSDVQEILAATERMSGLTSQLLAFTRKPTEAAERVELEPVLDKMSRRLSAAPSEQAVLEWKLPAEVHRVHANAAQLEQVIAAMLGRLRQAIRGTGKITVEISRVDIAEDLRRANAPLRPGAYAVIAMSAPGAAPQGEAKAALFECSVPGKEPWDEAAAALTRAYGMVRQWGGDIAISNGAEGPSIFRLFLPRVEGAAPAQVEPAAAEPLAARPPGAPLATILVAEDEAGIRALVGKILRRQNYEVLEAANGKEALAVCREYSGEIDLLITDVIMPQMGGRDLVEQLREQGRKMKVLFVSGYTDDASIYAGDLPPGTAFLQKPFTLGSLLDKVKEVLAAKLA